MAAATEALTVRQLAEKEVNGWLDFQCIPKRQRDSMDATYQRLVDGVEDGRIIINPDFSVIQKLKFPASDAVTELKFKPRLQVAEIKQAQELEPGEESKEDGKTTGYDTGFAYVKALTGQHKAMTGRMADKDYKLTDAIVLFFML